MHKRCDSMNLAEIDTHSHRLMLQFRAPGIWTPISLGVIAVLSWTCKTKNKGLQQLYTKGSLRTNESCLRFKGSTETRKTLDLLSELLGTIRSSRHSSGLMGTSLSTHTQVVWSCAGIRIPAFSPSHATAFGKMPSDFCVFSLAIRKISTVILLQFCRPWLRKHWCRYCCWQGGQIASRKQPFCLGDLSTYAEPMGMNGSNLPYLSLQDRICSREGLQCRKRIYILLLVAPDAVRSWKELLKGISYGPSPLKEPRLSSQFDGVHTWLLRWITLIALAMHRGLADCRMTTSCLPLPRLWSFTSVWLKIVCKILVAERHSGVPLGEETFRSWRNWVQMQSFSQKIYQVCCAREVSISFNATWKKLARGNVTDCFGRFVLPKVRLYGNDPREDADSASCEDGSQMHNFS